MKILVHDFSGHPGQIQLSRALAKRGHRVTHAYFPGAKTATGQVERTGEDSPNFSIESVAIGRPYEKYKYLQRFLAEREYGRRLGNLVLANDPDIFLTSNTPPDSLLSLMRRLKNGRTIPIWWLQDIYSIGIEAVISRKFRPLGRMVGGLHRRAEYKFGTASKAIVCISDAFIGHLVNLGIPKTKCHVIPNWGPVNEIVPAPKENLWKDEQGLSGKTIVLYAGTLGLKHNPSVLVEAARRLQATGKRDTVIMVVAGGLAAEHLRTVKSEQHLDQLLVLPWQPYNRLSEMLSSADVVVVQLESEAGEFSVPGKVLSYLCVGRPILAAIAKKNLAAQTIDKAEAGIVVDPDDQEGFLAALDRLLANPGLRERLGRNGRSFAERNFDIENITNQFEAVFARAIESRDLGSLQPRMRRATSL